MNVSLPDGWGLTSLGRFVWREPAMLDPADAPDELFEYYSIPAYKAGAPIVVRGSEILSQKQLIPERCVLFGKLNPRVEKVWFVASDSALRRLASTEWIVLNPTPEVDPAFLYFALWSDWVMPRAKTLVSGSTPSRERVEPGAFYDIEIPLPPPVEQRGIAAVLWRLRRAIQSEERFLNTVADLKQAAMQQLFRRGLRGEETKETDLGQVPASWNVVQMGTLGRIGNGSTPKRTDPRYWTGGTIPWLTSAKVYDRVVARADEFVTNVAVGECHLPTVAPGSLLIAITGQGKTLGNVAMTAIETTVSQHLAYVTLTQPHVRPNFLRHYLGSRYQVLRSLGQAGGSTKGALTCAGLKDVPVPVPSISEQSDIERVLDAIDQSLATRERKATLLRDLFNTLLHDLMTGRLRVSEVEAAAQSVARTA